MSINRLLVVWQGSGLESVLWSRSGVAQCSQTGDMGHTPQNWQKGDLGCIQSTPTPPPRQGPAHPNHGTARSTDLPGNRFVDCASIGEDLLCAVQSVVTDLPLLRRLSKHPCPIGGYRFTLSRQTEHFFEPPLLPHILNQQ